MGATFTEPYLMDEETLCALIDIARDGHSQGIAPSFRDRLLVKLANAAVLTLFGEHYQFVDLDSEADVVDFAGYELMVTFTRLRCF